MVDYYALPASGEKQWPGRAEANHKQFINKAHTVQSALSNDVIAEMGESFDPQRFVPYVVMYEFEGLLFSDCEAFARGIGQRALSGKFSEIRNAFDSPEEINDSPITAPSKRIKLLVPDYDKPLFANVAVLEVGLDKIREECPQFDQWLTALENCS